MRIIPYKQTTCESCLPACLLMWLSYIKGTSFKLEDEQELLFKGILFAREIYHIGILNEFSTKFNLPLKVWVGNKYFTKVLKNLPVNRKLEIEFQRINIPFIQKIIHKQKLFILHLDIYYLRHSVHAPHFVLVEKMIGDKIVIIDPWKGKRFYFTIERITKAIDSLRTYLVFCPILVTF